MNDWSAEGIDDVMRTFGISCTAARFHVFNAHYGQDPLPKHIALPGPSEDWLISENFTLDCFPIRSVPFQRRGRFAGLVAECHERGMLSSYTAALYLSCSEQEFLENAGHIRQLYAP